MTKKIFLKVWLVLIILTISTALVSNSTLNILNAAIVILGLAVVKFLGVSFYFMELKKAHSFWKTTVLVYVLLLSIILGLMLC